MSQDTTVGARSYGKLGVVIVDEKGPVLIGKPQFALFQHVAVLVLKNREQHLVFQLRIYRVQVDVKVGGIAGAGSVLQNIHPPSIAGFADTHVIGYYVQNKPQAVFAQGRGESLEFIFAAQCRVQLTVIANIVAIVAISGSLEDGRCITVADRKVVQIGDDSLGIREVKSTVELNPVSGRGDTHRIFFYQFESLLASLDAIHQKTEKSCTYVTLVLDAFGLTGEKYQRGKLGMVRLWFVRALHHFRNLW